jgi:tRNA A-37 threonylcarbamoyl transferase component Bud32
MFLTTANNSITSSLSQLEMFFSWLTESPISLLFLATSISAFVTYCLRISISPNRLTLTRQYISLDFWSHLHCHTQTHINWSRITQIALTEPTDSADPTKRSVVFSDDKKTLLEIPMSNLEPEDRSRLLHAIEKFAPQIKIQAKLIEALTPSQDKSYTELWLQSLNSSNTVNLEPLEPGHSLLSRYVVEQKLAVGGEGIAYLARDLKDLKEGIIELAPQVVLKETLIPPYVDRDVQKESVERFEREARLLKELHSQYIVGLRDYFIEDKRCYLVLDYVQGKSLRRLVESEGALSTQRVLELARQMAEILTFLHSKGVVHRDFTPDNLILQENGALKLIDFNVASDQGDGKTGTIVGKHAYVPAEQFRGKANKQSDIYALGATLFFLKEGRDPEPISQSKLPPAPREPEQQSDQESDQDNYQLLSKVVKACTALALKDRLQSSEALSELLSTNDEGHTIKISDIEEKEKEKEPVLREAQPEQELAAENG